MLLPASIQSKVQAILSEKIGKPVLIQSTTPLSGGSINHAVKLKTIAGNYFIKWNDAKPFPGMFAAEAKGLGLLKNAEELNVPEVIAEKEEKDYSFLLLEFIEPGPPKPNFFESFGQTLAKMHKHSNPKFGLDHDNYIGSLAQSNKQHTSWTDFFIEERLEKQIQMARDSGKLNPSSTKHFHNLYKRLEEIFPMEKPSLLHGDLWNGNYLTGTEGFACLIDPAVYYGFREMDIAMSKLFGGFSEGFYQAYQAEWHLEKGWKERIDICNLYPLLVHVNLFGGSYINDVQGIINKF